MSSVVRLRAFVDFWNFQLSWNKHTHKAPCDYSVLAKVLKDKCAELLAGEVNKPIELLEVRLYASYNPDNRAEQKLKEWLENTIAKFPHYRVFLRARHPRSRNVRCNECGSTIVNCPYCREPLSYAKEKGVDALKIIDLLSLAWADAYDVALLVTNDTDFVAAVERVQERGLRVVNATWKDQGIALSETCCKSFKIEEMAEKLYRNCLDAPEGSKRDH